MTHSLEIEKKKGDWIIKSRTLIYNPSLSKFHPKVRNLTSLLRHGFMLDEEDWYSITPECITKKIIKIVQKNKIDKLYTGKDVLCAFSGVGGDAIPFLRKGYNVTALDYSYKKIKYLKENYSVLKSITDKTGQLTSITGDFFTFSTDKSFFLAIVSPPWGGLSYQKNKNVIADMKISEIHNKLLSIAENMIYFLPRNLENKEIRSVIPDCIIKPAKDDRQKIVGTLVFYGKLFL